MTFTYSFDISEYSPHVIHLMDSDQAYIEQKIVMIIYESFVISGDEDYLTARLLAQKGLHRAFYWAAAQSIEKYLKALLLINGESIPTKSGHSIEKLFNKAVILDNDLQNISFTPHHNLKINKECADLIEVFTLDKFIKDIDKHGCADNRYNSFGVEFDTSTLFALDNFLFYLRSKIGVPDIFNSFNNIDAGLVSTFKDNNPLFCEDEYCHTEIPSQKFQISYSSSVTALDFVDSNENDHRHKYVLTWLNKKMQLPKSIRDKLKN
ncbi:HEPN domain-containing protein [Pseudoalteromonas sp. LC2018020214]|uniref:HEPN domain-containing protein n=1 Tax=Pseudoalteromonas sp. LC2018020214 TaxID=2799564 RepID=UPI0019044E76|nr:HEPN domain-containing protein [Pseudoalteromonas sp. LC2018020214]QQM65995.1 HEPN domain-containing protein [Pseudoalteromonas sp. LC2018020214]